MLTTCTSSRALVMGYAPEPDSDRCAPATIRLLQCRSLAAPNSPAPQASRGRPPRRWIFGKARTLADLGNGLTDFQL
jgi:hypothetical protein